MFWNRHRRSTWKGLAAGAIGGAVASFAMNQFQAGMSRLFERPSQPAADRRNERQAQGWKQHNDEPAQNRTDEERATVKTAVVLSKKVFDHELEAGEKEWAGQLVHYGYGTAVGGLYGLAAERWDDARAGEGSVFGAALWALSDEVGVPAMGLSRGPREYPLRTHVMALAAHVVYGVTAELTRRALRSGALSR